MESFSDLWGRLRSATPKGKVLNERAELVMFFESEINKRRQKNGQLPSKFFGYRLSHYSLSELYALKSNYSDRLRREGRETADKYWWWMTKTTKV
jgi:hypothetical protein